jgi:hypothetical protein
MCRSLEDCPVPADYHAVACRQPAPAAVAALELVSDTARKVWG